MSRKEARAGSEDAFEPTGVSSSLGWLEDCRVKTVIVISPPYIPGSVFGSGSGVLRCLVLVTLESPS